MANRQEALGKHFLVELYGCDPAILNDVKAVEIAMREAAMVSEATIVNYLFHEFQPIGVTGVVIIAESHISIHTWPEYRYAAVDIFTCGKEMIPEKAITLLKERLSVQNIDVTEVPRGIFPKSMRGLSG